MEIISEDKNIVVCIKPAGVNSQISNDNKNMIYKLSCYFKEKNENQEIFPVHRLDKETSGVMVYARNSSAAAFLSAQITKGVFKKEYIALVHGTPEPLEGKYEDLLFRDKQKNKSYVVKRERKGVKKAALEYKTLESRNNISKVRIKLLTGRTHQIRTQFASRHMPLLGDRKYGASDNEKSLALQCVYISFISPTDKKTVSFSIGDKLNF